MLKTIYKNGMMPISLNLGCGSEFLDYYLNLDANISIVAAEESAEQQQDCWIVEGLLTSPSQLPRNHFEHVKAEMVMEHIHIDAVPTMLYVLHSIMKPNGTLDIIVPDFHALTKAYTDKVLKETDNMERIKWMREITFQLLDPTLHDTANARGHQSIWTGEMAIHWLEGEGFQITNVETRGLFLHVNAIKRTEYSEPL